MRKYNKRDEERKELFVGIDLHRLRWQVTIRTADVELFNGSIPGRWEGFLIDTGSMRSKRCMRRATLASGFTTDWRKRASSAL